MRPIETSGAPVPVAPYSQAIVHAGVAYLAGQVPLDPSTGELVDGPIEAQAERVLQNVEAVLEASGSGWDRVLKVNVYLADIADFAAFNAIYERYLAGARPARSTYQVARLPLDARIEIDAIAAADSPES